MARIKNLWSGCCPHLKEGQSVLEPRGVAALFNRSLQLASLLQPVLHGIEAATPTTMDLSLLKARLAGQSPADAATIGALLLHTFHQLLSTQ